SSNHRLARRDLTGYSRLGAAPQSALRWPLLLKVSVSRRIRRKSGTRVRRALAKVWHFVGMRHASWVCQRPKENFDENVSHLDRLRAFFLQDGRGRAGSAGARHLGAGSGGVRSTEGLSGLRNSQLRSAERRVSGEHSDSQSAEWTSGLHSGGFQERRQGLSAISVEPAGRISDQRGQDTVDLLRNGARRVFSECRSEIQ